MGSSIGTRSEGRWGQRSTWSRWRRSTSTSSSPFDPRRDSSSQVRSPFSYGVSARAFTPEHLAAIALQTGRAKDKTRLLQFVEEGALDAARLQAILRRHDLVDVWAKFERQFLSDTP